MIHRVAASRWLTPVCAPRSLIYTCVWWHPGICKWPSTATPARYSFHRPSIIFVFGNRNKLQWFIRWGFLFFSTGPSFIYFIPEGFFPSLQRKISRWWQDCRGHPFTECGSWQGDMVHSLSSPHVSLWLALRPACQHCSRRLLPLVGGGRWGRAVEPKNRPPSTPHYTCSSC